MEEGLKRGFQLHCIETPTGTAVNSALPGIIAIFVCCHFNVLRTESFKLRALFRT